MLCHALSIYEGQQKAHRLKHQTLFRSGTAIPYLSKTEPLDPEVEMVKCTHDAIA